ncbi:hypothetical protein [Pectobacterium aroidearum]|uniref:hypothetical protein n=1 Tax=Pectobacterium aroidearum TaxID=1201031 RepID=UPI00301A79C7
MVKRWSVGVDGEDPNGNLVKYTDYAELERQRDELVAECEFIKNKYLEFAKHADQAVDKGVGITYHESFILSLKSPSTDTALREVGAKAVEAFAEQQAQLALEYFKLSPGCYGEKSSAENSLMAREYAQQLREGKV